MRSSVQKESQYQKRVAALKNNLKKRKKFKGKEKKNYDRTR